MKIFPSYCHKNILKNICFNSSRKILLCYLKFDFKQLLCKHQYTTSRFLFLLKKPCLKRTATKKQSFNNSVNKNEANNILGFQSI